MKNLEYTNGKTKFIGHLAGEDGGAGRRPGIIVFPEAFGLGDHAKKRADRLAQLGPVIQGFYDDRAEWRSRARAALDALRAQPGVDGSRLAAIGYCFGGTTALELARSGAPLAAIATFHAGLIAELPEDAGRLRARVLINHGADDPLVKKEVIDTVMTELRRDKVDWQVVFYGNAVHSFTNPEADARQVPALKYDKKADERSWLLMRHLFDEAFG